MKSVQVSRETHPPRPTGRRKMLVLEDAEYPVNLHEARALFDTRLLEHVLRSCNGNVSEAARKLNLSRRNLQIKIRNFDIDICRIRSEMMFAFYQDVE